MFTYEELRVLKFIGGQVFRQDRDARYVEPMAKAWAVASKAPWTVDTVLEIGAHVEPLVNRGGFRTMPVTVNGNVIDAVRIRERVSELMDMASWGQNKEYGLKADEFYQEFERIHPFRDGNGRVGAILYNMLLERMSDPIDPPEFNE
jgi:Fic/DOC family